MGSDLKYILARATGIPAIFNIINRKRLLVLAYHGIYDGPRNRGGLPPTFVHLDDMIAQLRWLKKAYRITHPDELLQSIETNKPLPPSSALVTFDDAYESFYRLAEPILRSLSITPIVFVPTRYVERHEPFWFDVAWLFLNTVPPSQRVWINRALPPSEDTFEETQGGTGSLDRLKHLSPDKRDPIIEEMSRSLYKKLGNAGSPGRLFLPMDGDAILKAYSSGIRFGGHTHTHTILTAISTKEAECEIRINKSRLDTLLSRNSEFFAYPNGGADDFDDEHKAYLISLGYKGSFSLTQSRVSPAADCRRFLGSMLLRKTRQALYRFDALVSRLGYPIYAIDADLPKN